MSHNRSVLVVGASRGLGRTTALTLAARGLQVAVAARTMNDLTDLAAQIDALTIVLDVRDASACAAAVASCTQAFGGLDAIVYNAGVTHAGPFIGIDEAVWSDVFEVNVLGASRLLRAALPVLMEGRDPHVVTIGSTASLRGFPLVSPYVVTKHALLGLTRALAVEHPAVAFDCVCPGYIDTDMVEGALQAMTAGGMSREEALRRLLREQSRLLDPQEVADRVAELCLEQHGAGTGRVFEVVPTTSSTERQETTELVDGSLPCL